MTQAGPTGPTFSDFVSWVRSYMQISTTVLPDNSTALQDAYDMALQWVNQGLACAGPTVYRICVYNLAGSNLINYAEDIPNAPAVPGTEPPLPYFAAMRQKWNCLGFVPGVISSSSDEGTSQSLTVARQLETLSLADLQMLKDPYGQRYLQIAQQYGTLWGVS